MKKNGEKYQVPDMNIKDIKLYRGHLYSAPDLPEAQEGAAPVLMKVYLSYFLI